MYIGDPAGGGAGRDRRYRLDFAFEKVIDSLKFTFVLSK
jgi:hypothetical protein